MKPTLSNYLDDKEYSQDPMSGITTVYVLQYVDPKTSQWAGESTYHHYENARVLAEDMRKIGDTEWRVIQRTTIERKIY